MNSSDIEAIEAMQSDLLFPNLLPYDSDDDFANYNAPTPLLTQNFVDLADIESDDLIGYNGDDSNGPLVGANNSALIDMNVANQEEVMSADTNIEANAEQMQYSVTHEEVHQMYGHNASTVSINTRKRHISYPSTYGAEESDDDQSSGVTEVRSKAKVGRKPKKNNKCMTKNAIAARENRERKKQYIEGLERRAEVAERDNKVLVSRNEGLKRENADLTNRNAYLENIIANDSQISAVIKHVSNLPNIQFIDRQFIATKDEDSLKADRKLSSSSAEDKSLRKSSRIAAKTDIPGICVHIKNNKTFLRMCDQCSTFGKKSTKKGK